MMAPTIPPERAQTSGRGNSLELIPEESELRYRRLFETAQDGILILDADSGRIIDVNPFLLHLLDYSFESVIGLQLWEIGLFEDIAANQAAFTKLQENEYIRYENLPLRTRAGQHIEVEFVSNVYFVGSTKVIQCNIRDISARSKAMADCREDLATLEVSAKTKDHVLGILSHELRTPLAAISYAAEFLEASRDGNGARHEGPSRPDVDQSAVAVIRRNVRSLTRMINELLDLTYLAKGTLELKREEIDAHDVIRLATDNLESQKESNGVEIRLDLAARRSGMRGDPDKLEQVMSNLIGNALKFTPRGGHVSVVTRNEPGDKLIIEVSDTGIGISPGALERIFSPFEQGDSSIHPRFGGLGLGLSIAHTLTEAQGGTLKADSAGVGHGAKFTVYFSLSDSKPNDL